MRFITHFKTKKRDHLIQLLNLKSHSSKFGCTNFDAFIANADHLLCHQPSLKMSLLTLWRKTLKYSQWNMRYFYNYLYKMFFKGSCVNLSNYVLFCKFKHSNKMRFEFQIQWMAILHKEWIAILQFEFIGTDRDEEKYVCVSL